MDSNGVIPCFLADILMEDGTPKIDIGGNYIYRCLKCASNEVGVFAT